MTYINSDVLPELYSAALNWASRLGASSLPSVSFPGTSVPAAGPCAAGIVALPRVRAKVAVPAPLGQANIHNSMTGVPAVGEGASGPPRDREPV